MFSTTLALLLCLALTKTTTGNFTYNIECPDLQYLVSDSWRQRMWEHVMVNRYAIAVGGAASIQQYVNLLPAMRMNGLTWNCDVERNLWVRYIPDLKCAADGSFSYTPYGEENWGTNFIAFQFPQSGCTLEPLTMAANWWFTYSKNYNKNNLTFPSNSTPEQAMFANFAKWNATEFACAFKGCSFNPTLTAVICAFHTTGEVVGELIYESSRIIQYCNATNCNGTCAGPYYYPLCMPKLPAKAPGADLQVVVPEDSGPMNCTAANSNTTQFVRFTAITMHNYYRKKVARGWAKDQTGQNLPPAADMKKMMYDCDLELSASKLADKCTETADPTLTGGKAVLFKKVNDGTMTTVKAVEEAMKSWYDEVGKATLGDPPKATNAVKGFANMIHDENSKVGCAIKSCSGSWLFACLYDQPFVANDSPIYQSGTTCTGCKQTCVGHTFCP
ncbi:hypothetical protein Q1695_015708 [Nippostrongylus brasiliensis]|nr:hypothetical protein Q1695_015708 [Nippostrongylus brasiliensis]